MSSNSRWKNIGVLGKSGKRFRYNKAKLLGAGGFGRVYDGEYFTSKMAFKLGKGVRVAVKKMFKNETDLQEREIAIQGTLQHEHVIKLLFHDQDFENRYLVLEKAVCSLKDFVEKNENSHGIQLSTETILKQTTLGLEHIHSKNIIHRDVKLSNYLIFGVNSEAVIKIADFGISKKLDPDKTSCTNSRVPFTKGYSACEILRNLRARKGSDIFSLGIVFYKVFQPKLHPFGDNDIDIAVNIRDREDPDLKLIDADMYRKLIAIMISHESTVRPTATNIAAHLNLLELGYDGEDSKKNREIAKAYLERIVRRNTKYKRVPGNDDIANSLRGHTSPTPRYQPY